MLRPWLVGLAVGGLACGNSLAGDTLAWLSRMTEAVDGLNYRGTFVYFDGDQSRTMRVVHRADAADAPDAVRERMLALDGPPREVLRSANESRCIMPAQRAVIVDRRSESPLRAALPDYRGGIEDFYRVVYLGEERVAGRVARRLSVNPVDEYRFGYQLWLDDDTTMPLKTMTVAHGGRVVELMHFTSIEFPAEIADAELRPTLLGEGFTTHHPVALSARAPGAESAWVAGRLPPGFRLSIATREVTANGHPGEHLVYSDGLASVSVFIEAVRERAVPTPAFAEFGTASAYSRILDGHRIVVIGEVPADTVTMIGRSMRPTGAVDR